MDSFGQGFLIVVIVVIATWIVWAWLLTRHGPPGFVTAVSLVLFGISMLEENGKSRAMLGLMGLFRVLAISGFIIGAIAWFRRPRDDKPDK